MTIPTKAGLIGWTLRDPVTGFEGICTAYIEYLSGCNRVLLSPKVGGDGRLPDSQWFDDHMVEMVEGVNRVEPYVPSPPRGGGPTPTPSNPPRI